LLVIVARDLDAYSDLLQRKLHRLPGVRPVHTHFSLQEFKGRIGGLPVPL
jgi:DNA-binding Lrp family transcriptional regulator